MIVKNEWNIQYFKMLFIYPYNYPIIPNFGNLNKKNFYKKNFFLNVHEKQLKTVLKLLIP